MLSDKTKFKLAKTRLNAMEYCFYPLFYKRHKDVEAREGVAYGERKLQKLDVYGKDGIGAPRPVFVYIHGGGWISGLRTARRYYCEHWAEQDFTVLNIGYRYGVDVAHPCHLKDVFAGLDYAMDRAEEWGLDLSAGEVIAGESAGAYLAAYVAAAASRPELLDMYGIEFRHANEFKVAASVLISGVYSLTRVAKCKFPDIDVICKTVCGMDTAALLALNEEERTAKDAYFSPESFVDEKFAPSFVIGSAADSLRGESEALFEKLQRLGVKSEYFLCTGLNGVHAGALACDLAPSGRECVREAVSFAKGVLNRANG